MGIESKDSYKVFTDYVNSCATKESSDNKTFLSSIFAIVGLYISLAHFGIKPNPTTEFGGALFNLYASIILSISSSWYGLQLKRDRHARAHRKIIAGIEDGKIRKPFNVLDIHVKKERISFLPSNGIAAVPFTITSVLLMITLIAIWIYEK